MSLVFEAILLSVAGIALLVAFILVRRGWRSRIFRRRDARVIEVRNAWNGIVSGTVAAEEWRDNRLTCEIVEGMLLDRLEVASGKEAERLLGCVRASGLLDLRIQEARRRRGWRRRRALASLGRMRAPEAVPALADALDDHHRTYALVAVRGLGRLGQPEGAAPILERLIAGSLASLPPVQIQNALLSCCRSRPQLLVPYIHRADAATRPLIARVLGELATGDLDGDDLVLLASDPQAEVRASAARALTSAPLNVALSMLGTLAEDDEWFVRLRAIVALGQLQHPRAIPPLIDGLCDRNRLVRVRAATGLAHMDDQVEEVLDLVEARKDRYALQALVSELETSGAMLTHVDRLASEGPARERAARVLLRVLRLGAHRLLVSALGGHRDRRVRFQLARLVAHSRLRALVPLLERARDSEPARRRRDLYTWVLEQIDGTARIASRQRRRRGGISPAPVR
jgi:HEAT repeat protein